MITFLKDFGNKAFGWVTGPKVTTYFVIILYTIIVFLLGRLSGVFDRRPVFEMETFPAEEYDVLGREPASEESLPVSTSTIYASRNGKKYYFAWCKNSIKPGNRVYFESVEEAEQKGLTKAAGCK